MQQPVPGRSHVDAPLGDAGKRGRQMAGVSLPICEMGFFPNLLCLWLFPFGLQCPPFLSHVAKYTRLLLQGLFQMPPPPGSLPSCPSSFLQFKETSPSEPPTAVYADLCVAGHPFPNLDPLERVGRALCRWRLCLVHPASHTSGGQPPDPLGVGEGCPGRARRRLGAG